MRLLPSLLMLGLLAVGGPVLNQDQDPPPGGTGNETAEPEQETPTKPPSAVSDNERAVWQLHVRAVAARFDLDLEEHDQLFDMYLKLRTEHAEVEADIRREWRKYVAERLKQPGSGEIQLDPSAFELEYRLGTLRRWKRSQLARKLVELFGEERAKAIHPALAPFDGSHDKMIHLISNFELGEKKTFAAIDLVDQYYLDAAAAQSKARQRREPLLDALRPVRERLLAKLGEMLSTEQVATFARKSHLVRPQRRRRR